MGKSQLARAHASPRGAAILEASHLGRDALPPVEVDLVVLDHADADLPAAAALARAWLEDDSDLRVVVTSRQRLGIPNEHVVEVAPLDPEAAVELFLTTARAARPGYASAPEDAERVVRIVDLLDRLPLALRLAAARASLLQPADLLDRLHSPLEVLHDAAEPDRSLRALLDASFDRLPPDARTALAWLGTFDCPFDVAAAEAVAGHAPRGDGTPVLDLLQLLVERSLLARAEDAPSGGARFELLRVVRAYARAALATSEQAEAAAGAHGAWLADRTTALASTLGGPRGPAAIRALKSLGGLTEALEHPERLPRDAAGRLDLAFDRLCQHRGSGTDHAFLLDGVLAAAGTPADPRLLAARARIDRRRGDVADALGRLPDSDLPAVRLERAACLAAADRIRDTATEAVELHRSLARRRDDPIVELNAAARAGQLLAARGKLEEVADLLDDALSATSTRVGPLPLVGCLLEAARVELLRGRGDRRRCAPAGPRPR